MKGETAGMPGAMVPASQRVQEAAEGPVPSWSGVTHSALPCKTPSATHCPVWTRAAHGRTNTTFPLLSGVPGTGTRLDSTTAAARAPGPADGNSCFIMDLS